MSETIATACMGAGFAIFVVVATAIDLLLLRGPGDTPVAVRQALGWSAVWVAVAGVFPG